MWFVVGVSAVVVALLAVAVVVDLRDRKRGGTRRILLPGWLERRGRGAMAASPIAWKAEDYRPRSPREREHE
ncbi:hypothetical protein SAMN05216266_1352 [Amycolatopsis marina]|uniref:Uncharacterized protein n=1 Tax=Amycolatopsis marina TaxID=490629 RepID=A0A1I1CLL2_9PSEU|nr:hypothetical protein [Amycolatopsis marina]SFB63414.1 hypothetical protein SAMN05216266_1352 [Amycolatopsis marina]